MKRMIAIACVLSAATCFGAGEPGAPKAGGKKVEKSPVFIQAKADPLLGDWQGKGMVAQVFVSPGGQIEANLLKGFDMEGGGAIATLQGKRTGDTIAFTGGGWTATLESSHFTGSKGSESFEMQHIDRVSPTLGAAPPKDAVVLFDGKNLDAWAKKSGKEWLKEDGPAKWKLVDGGAMEVVPESDCIITHQKFGDCHVHVEFRTLGTPTNSGVFLEDRYEANINETYGKLDGTPNGGFDNCTDKKEPTIRACYPPLAWQTFDIDFTAPRFDASGKKTESARATVEFNGVKIYDKQELDLPHGAAARLGEAPTGPLMLQEHGMPLQFRNIWVVESKSEASAK